jgi:hypothetical protein
VIDHHVDGVLSVEAYQDGLNSRIFVEVNKNILPSKTQQLYGSPELAIVATSVHSVKGSQSLSSYTLVHAQLSAKRYNFHSIEAKVVYELRSVRLSVSNFLARRTPLREECISTFIEYW